MGTRITEHRKEAEKISDRNFTRSTRRAFTNEHHKPAITDHVCQNSHIMNWEASEIVEQESDKFKRWIQDSICIKPKTTTTTTTSLFLTLNIQISHHLQIARLIEAGGV